MEEIPFRHVVGQIAALCNDRNLYLCLFLHVAKIIRIPEKSKQNAKIPGIVVLFS
jgi:hypothetical protein